MRLFWKTFLTSNETRYRLARTILQGVIGVITAYLDAIVGLMPIPNEMRPMIVALVMAILSPLMSELGTAIEKSDRAIQNADCEEVSEEIGGDDDDDGREA